VRITEDRQKPWAAKEIMLKCPRCTGIVTVPMPYKPTAEVRQRLMSQAIDEHRRVCVAADSADGRVYSIHYPRL